ncbi:MAG TPA: hypothetical protein VGI06_05220 [Acidimicrobiales bacterium]
MFRSLVVVVVASFRIPLAARLPGDGKPTASRRAHPVGMTETINPIDRYLAAIEEATMDRCDALAPDVTLDATVPNWRFNVVGDEAVRSELARWYADPGSFEELVRTPLPHGELVEFTLRWVEGGVPHAVHQAHKIEVAGDRIARDQVWCGGRWSATLLAEMADAQQ